MAYPDHPHWQITVVGVPDDNNTSSASSLPSPSLDTSRSAAKQHTSSWTTWNPWSPSTDNHGHFSRPTPILRSEQNSLDAFCSCSNSLHPPHPSPTQSGSISSCWVVNSSASRDNNQEHTSFLLPHGHHRKRGNSSTAKYNSSFRLNPLRSVHSPPRDPHPHSRGSKFKRNPASAVTNFFRRTVHRVRRLSSPPSGETDTGSYPTRNDGQKGKYQKQSTVLNNLEERLKVANRLHEDAVALQMLYESGTVATMKDLRAGNAVPVVRGGEILKMNIFRTSAATSTGQCPILRGGLGAG
jgi:hypothetical protein